MRTEPERRLIPNRQLSGIPGWSPSPADSLLEQALCLCHRLGARLADLQGGACCTSRSLGALRFMDALTELLWHAHVGVPNSATTASRLLSPQPRLPAPHP